MTDNRKISVSVLGTCVSRDIFDFAAPPEKEKYVVDRFVQSVSPISALKTLLHDSDAFCAEVDSLFDVNDFWKRCIKLDYTGTAFDFLSQKISDWFLVDMGSLRTPLHPVKAIAEGRESMQYLSAELFYDIYRRAIASKDRMKLVASIHNSKTVDVLDFDDTTFSKYLDAYCDKILQLYDENQIVLVEQRFLSRFVGNSKVIFARDKNAELCDRRIQRGYDYVLKKFPKAHVIAFPCTVTGNIGHKWGQYGLHYIDEYYEYAIKAMNIITQRLQLEKEKSLLRDLCDEYTSICWQAFCKSAEAYYSRSQYEAANKTARIDITLSGENASFDLCEIINGHASAATPSWLQRNCKGYTVESNDERIKLVFKAGTAGKLMIYLRGQDIRQPADNTKRIPVWIDYTMLKVNGKVLLNAKTPAWHDASKRFSSQVGAGENVIIEASWVPHVSE